MVKRRKIPWVISCYGTIYKEALNECRKCFRSNNTKKECLEYSEKKTKVKYNGETKYLAEISYRPKNKNKNKSINSYV